jgi:hypothetical protein
MDWSKKSPQDSLDDSSFELRKISSTRFRFIPFEWTCKKAGTTDSACRLGNHPKSKLLLPPSTQHITCSSVCLSTMLIGSHGFVTKKTKSLCIGKDLQKSHHLQICTLLQTHWLQYPMTFLCWKQSLPPWHKHHVNNNTVAIFTMIHFCFYWTSSNVGSVRYTISGKEQKPLESWLPGQWYAHCYR